MNSNHTAVDCLDEPRDPDEPDEGWWKYLEKRDGAWDTLHDLQFRRVGEIKTTDTEWLIKGFWPLGSHGMWGGAEKSYKSTLVILGLLCVASGRPFFGHEVVKPGPVFVFTGEGSVDLFKRRLVRHGKFLGLTPEQVNDLPIAVSSMRLAITKPEFQAGLRACLDLDPVLVVIDPLYAYHGTSSSGGSVYEEGDLLALMSDLTMPAGVALWVVHHFNKAASAGGRLTLSGLTMAGPREWVDSWVLMAKREEPVFDVDEPVVHLRVETGTRQAEVGHCWDVDLWPGKYDEEACRYDGDVSWECTRGVDRVPLI